MERVAGELGKQNRPEWPGHYFRPSIRSAESTMLTCRVFSESFAARGTEGSCQFSGCKFGVHGRSLT